MKKLLSWQAILVVILLGLSAGVYFVHYLIFRDARSIFFYLISDVAFLFVQVLLLTLFIAKLLAYREKKSLLKKLNMVIGAFFSEVGTPLIKIFCAFDARSDKIAEKLIVTDKWSNAHFQNERRQINNIDPAIDCKRADLKELKSFLVSKRSFMLTLLENPNLLEHESFTNLLWAVFHLTEELDNRHSFVKLTQNDAEHLDKDIKRAYKLLINQWLLYMGHLKNDYPYLFSLAMRTNPFDPNASVELK